MRFSSAARSATSATSSSSASGFGIKDVKINGGKETSEIAVLEQLDLAGSLISFDVEDAQKRLAQLPWVERASVRKFYPGTLVD